MMETIVVWLMFFTAGNSTSVPVKFPIEADCKATLARLERMTAEKNGMPYIKGVCVEAKIIKE